MHISKIKFGMLLILLALICVGCQEKKIVNSEGKTNKVEKDIQKVENKSDKKSENEAESEEQITKEILNDDVNEPKYVICKSELEIDADDNVLNTRRKYYVYNAYDQVLFELEGMGMASLREYKRNGELYQYITFESDLYDAEIDTRTLYENGKKTERQKYGYNGNLFCQEFWRYDEEGNCVLYEKYDLDDAVIKNLYYYQDNNLVKKEEYEDDNLLAWETYQYDEYDKLLRMDRNYYFYGELRNTYEEHSYRYDDAGNEIENYEPTSKDQSRNVMEYYENGVIKTRYHYQELEDGTRMTQYSFNENGDVVEITNDNFTDTYVYEYDSNNKIIKEKKFRDGEFQEGVAQEEYVLSEQEYDEFIADVKDYLNIDEEDEKIKVFGAEKNDGAKGVIKSSSSQYAGSSTIYVGEYNEYGDEVLSGTLTQDSTEKEINYTYEHEYDAEGNKRKRTTYDSTGIKTFETYYDEKGNASFYVSYYEGEEERTDNDFNYEYDSRGNLLKIYRTDETGEVIYEETWEYDENGDWIKHYYISDDGRHYMEEKDGKRVTTYLKRYGSYELYAQDEYDIHGQLTNSILFTNGCPWDMHSFEYKYAYDKNGNILVRKEYSQGKLYSTTWYTYWE